MTMNIHSIQCHVGSHVDFAPMHLAFHSPLPTPVGPASELGPAPPFPPIRVAEMYRSRGLAVSCVKRPFNDVSGNGWEVPGGAPRAMRKSSSVRVGETDELMNAPCIR